MAAHGARARVADVHAVAAGLPGVTVEHGPLGNAIYQVGRKSFVFFRTPRPDATDPATGERYDDVIVFWVPSESDKQALIQDPGSPWFSTPHFEGHPSVLLRACRIAELSRQELTEVVEEAWLSRASRARGEAWLAARAGGRAPDGSPGPRQPTGRRADGRATGTRAAGRRAGARHRPPG